jgi:tripartite ATP-independent transporter DctM subunit
VAPEIVAAIGIGAVIVLLFLGVPVAFSLILVGFLGYAYLTTIPAALFQLSSGLFHWLFDYTFTVLPLFVFMGVIVANSRISPRLFGFANSWVGQLPGGLAMATIGGCALFAAVSGSSTATSATMCKVAHPMMEAYRYKPELSAGCVATGGTLGILIPPSLGLIIYSMISETPLGGLFMAGIIPGVLHAVLYMIVIMVWCRIDPAAGPPGPRSNFRDKLRTIGGTGEVLAIFALVMGGIFFGFFTPTEAGAVGVAGVLIIAVSRRMLTWKQFLESIWDTLLITGMLTLLFAGGVVFAKFIAVSRLPFELAHWVAGLEVHGLLIMIAILLIYFITGCLMDMMSVLIITIPIFMPIVAIQGYDPTWFGVAVVVMIEMALVTPPIGLNVWTTAGLLPHIGMDKIFKGILIFLIGDFLIMALLLAFPQIALFLPSLMTR